MPVEVSDLVVGGTLEAYLFAFVNSMHILDNTDQVDLLRDEPSFGLPSRGLFLSRLKFMQSMLGKSVFYTKPESIRICSKECKIVKGQYVKKILFKKCYVFDQNGVHFQENELICKRERLEVLDRFRLSSMVKSENFKTIVSGDDFVNKIYFHRSDFSFKKNPSVGECSAVSYLTTEQLQNFDFSDTIVRFKLEKMLKENGYRGKRAGYLSDGSSKYSRIKIEHIHREIRSQPFVYGDSESIKFLDTKIEQIINENQK